MAFDTTSLRQDLRVARQRTQDLDGLRQMSYPQMMMTNSRLRGAGLTKEASTVYLTWIKIQGWA